MEKLRLGSPSAAHVDLATLNRHQTEHEINETLYGLQRVSPFPKLPPYFVHKSASEDNGDRDGSETNVKAPRGIRKPTEVEKKKGGPPGSVRPPSGKSGVSIITPSVSDGSVLDHSHGSTFGDLLTRAWHIPDEEDENA